MKRYFVIDPSNGVHVYAGSADLKIQTFTNFRPWATKLTHKKALELANQKKEYKILTPEEFAETELIPSTPKNTVNSKHPIK